MFNFFYIIILIVNIQIYVNIPAIVSVGIGHCPIPNNGPMDFGPNGDVQSNSNSKWTEICNFGQFIL